MAWSPSENTAGGYAPVLWLDANTIAQGNGTKVANWTDRSSSANNAAQATDAYKPIFYTNYVNGYPVVYFTYTPTQQWMGGGVSGMNTAQFSVFAVVAPFPISGQLTKIFYMGLGDGAGTARRTPFDIEFTQALRSFQKYASNVPVYSGPIQLMWNKVHLFSCTWNTSGGDNYPAYWLDKISVTPISRTAAGSGAVLLDADRYGLARTGSLSNTSNLLLAELIYYPIVLSDADRQQVEHYLDDKYRICPVRVQSPIGGHLGTMARPQSPIAGHLGAMARPQSPIAGHLGTMDRPKAPQAGVLGRRCI